MEDGLYGVGEGPNTSLMVAFYAREKQLFGVEFRKNVAFLVLAHRRDRRQLAR